MPTVAIESDERLDIVLSHIPDPLQVAIHIRTTEAGMVMSYPDSLAVQVAAGLAAQAAYVEVPESVHMRQARHVPIAAGLFDMVDAAITADTSPQGLLNANSWEYETVVRRDSPLIASLGAGLGLTSTQIDDLFRQAALVA